MNIEGSFRKKNGFTIAGNTLVRDKKLSLKAKGLYLLIMSYITMDNLSLTKSFLQEKCPEGKKAFCSAWDELKQTGYLKIYMKQSSHGWQSEYDLLEEPINGPYCFYQSSDGQITSTNETKYAKPRESISEGGCQNLRTPQNGTYGQGTYAEGTYANGGDNIILLNNTLNNTLDKTPSINHPALTSCSKDERLSEEALRKIVEDELQANLGISYEYKADERKMEAAIRTITNWYEKTDKHFRSEYERSTFNLLVESIVEMACDSEIRTYKGSQVTYTKIIDKINECIKADGDLSHFTYETVDDYMKAAALNEIKDKRKYMKAVIWNSLCTYKVKFESCLAREIY